MASINKFSSMKVTTRGKTTISENAFPYKNTVYSKRKAESSPPKLKNSKRPALNDLTNDGKTAKLKSILNKNDKSLNVGKDKCIQKEEVSLKVKSGRAITGVRLPPARKPVPAKPVNETKSKTTETTKKPTSKPVVQGTKSKTIVQTKLTSQTGIVLRQSLRLQNQNALDVSKNESSVKEKETVAELNEMVAQTKLTSETGTVLRRSLRLQTTHDTSRNESSAKGKEAEFNMTADKSLESNSLYVSALDDLTTKDKKNAWYELSEFDKELIHDPHQVSLYAGEIFHYLKTREAHFHISDYMSRLTDITEEMRSILVDWMVEVQENYELNHETLYLSVKIVDSYLDKISEIRRDKLQLVGVSAMFLACKYDERLSPLLDDFVYVCDGAYEPKDILAMEQRLLDSLKYELSFPISYSFLRRYARCARVPMPLLTLARFILELSLVDYSTVTLSDSKQAAAALYLAFRMVKHDNWTESLVSYTGYKVDEFKDIVFLFNSILRKKFPKEVKAVRTKYSHEIFFEVAKTRLISDEELKKNMAEHS